MQAIPQQAVQFQRQRRPRSDAKRHLSSDPPADLPAERRRIRGGESRSDDSRCIRRQLFLQLAEESGAPAVRSGAVLDFRRGDGADREPV